MNIRNVLKGLIASAFLAGILVSCGGSDDEAAPATVVRTAALDGTQAGTGATGTGRGAVVVNPTTRAITGGITFTGLTGTGATAAHIHRANADAFITLVPSPENAVATVPADTVLTVADYAELLAGTLYFNVHTVANSANGEIRGQITGQGGVVAGLATLNGAQEGPTNTSTATGRGTIVVDLSPTPASRYEILIAYATHDVSSPNPAHIHTGAFGVQGGAADVATLTVAANVVTALQGATISALNLTNLQAGNTYFNIHSPGTYAAGEIRGQIAVQ
jgi:hypothetical protein